MKSFTITLAIIFCVTGTAWAQAPDPVLSFATCESTTPRSIINTPHGGGDTLQMARVYGGGTVDATITVTLIDGNGNPVPGYPAEDIWLGFLDPEPIIACPGGNIADGSTNAVGQTTISNSLRAGGSGTGAGVMIGTWPTPEFPIEISGGDLFRFNSPDINGDLQVNLSDIALFAGDFYGVYNYRSDYFWNGIINLSDVALMAQSVGAQCP